MATSYAIVDITPTVVIGVSGRPERAHLVTFVTEPSKLSSEIRVLDTDLSPDNVAKLVGDAAANLERIKAL